MISLKSQREIDIVRAASEKVDMVFEEVKSRLYSGVTTRELDRIAEAKILAERAIPAFKGYHGFPASICASVNEEVVHGIPSERMLEAGDIVSIDVGVKYQGFYADAARTFIVGSVSSAAKRLVDVTRDAFFFGIQSIKAGSRLGDLSSRIQLFAEKNGFAVVRDFVGHGIGRELHEEPQIPNFGVAGTGPVLEEGMVLAIEPMVNAGTWEVELLDNRWTVITRDRQLSAHYEDTVVIRKDRVEVLTQYV